MKNTTAARARSISLGLMLSAALAPTVARAEDWPEWRGKGRLGVWNEDGVLEKFPAGGLKFEWRVPIHAGYSGPSVAAGKVFVTDFQSVDGLKGVERALCLDEATGKILWTHDRQVDYAGLSYNYGPRATPTVDGDRVYCLGSMGDLDCLKGETGEAVWSHNYLKDFDAELPMWGMACAPLVEGDLLLAMTGGQPDANVVAMNKLTGEVAWKAVSANAGPGYAQPILVTQGGARQMIMWDPQAVRSLDPATGKELWSYPFKIKNNASIAQTVLDGDKLFVTAFYDGAVMLKLDADKPGASVLWKGNTTNEITTDGLHACHVTPMIHKGHIYGICSYGQFRCLKEDTGERLWESLEITKENKRWASAHIVRHGDVYFMNNDRGELIIGRLEPDDYHEIDRAELIKPTTGGAGRRDLGAVNWSHPAYANRHLITRNDEEIVRVSLEKTP